VVWLVEKPPIIITINRFVMQNLTEHGSLSQSKREKSEQSFAVVVKYTTFYLLYYTHPLTLILISKICWNLPTIPQGIAAQETNIDLL
jgi:hypothetical protein